LYTVVESSFSLRTREEKEEPKKSNIKVLYVAAFDDVKMQNDRCETAVETLQKRVINVTLYDVCHVTSGPPSVQI